MSRAAVIFHAFSCLLLLAAVLWGAFIYPTLPASVPVHWGPSGVPDAFGARSIWSAFGPLMLAVGLAVGVFILDAALMRARFTLPSERRAYGLALAYSNLYLTLLFVWISVATWYVLSLGPLFMVLGIVGGLPVLLIVAFHLPAITRERKALREAGDPSSDPEHWVLGGIFYSNPNDPRAFVPKRRSLGWGMTMNLASPGGRIAAIGILIIAVLGIALPLLL